MTAPGGAKSARTPMVPVFAAAPLATGGAARGHTGGIGDLDGDGRADLVLAGADGSLRTLLAVDDPAAPGGRRFAPGATVAAENRPRAILVADLSGDGVLDVAVAALFSNDVAIALGDGAGGLSAPVHVRAEATGPADLAEGDFDGDGLLDLAIAAAFSHQVSILKGDGAGGFTFAGKLPTGALPLAIAAADLDGNGTLDLATGSTRSGLTVLLGDGTGRFQPRAPLPPTPPVTFPFADDLHVAADLAIADWNGDGAPDIALVRVDRPQVEIHLGEPDPVPLDVPRRPLLLPTSLGPRSVRAADWNGDGQLDLAVLASFANEVAIFLGLGPVKTAGGVLRPRFTRPIHQLAPPAARELVVGELGGSARPDLLIAASASGSGGGGSGIGSTSLAMMSMGALPPPEIVSVAPPRGPRAGGTAITILGLNFQAGAQVFVDGLPATGVSVSPQNRITATVPPAALGSGGAADVRVRNPDSQVAVRPGAFTYEIAAGPGFSFTRLLFCNDGAESVGTPTLPALPDCSERIFKDAEAADFDGDGLLDIFAASADSTTASDQVYLNTGSRTFHLLPTATDPARFVAAGLFTAHDAAGAAVQPRYDVQAANFVLEGTGEFLDRRQDLVSVDGFDLRLLVNKGPDASGVPRFVDEAQTRLYDGTTLIDRSWSSAVAAECSCALDPTCPSPRTFTEIRDNDFDSFVWDDIDIGDLDLDGDLDIALANRNRETCFNQGPGRAGGRGTFVLRNTDGRGSFEPVALPLADTRADHDVEMVDIDHDCDLDLVFSGHSGTPPSPPTVLINGIRSSCSGTPGTLSFTEDASRLGGLPASFNFVGAEALSGPLDVNGDGLVDLVFGGTRDALLLNRSGAVGSFEEVTQRAGGEALFPAGAFTYGGAFGDLDLDGRVDLLLGDYGGRPTVFLNRIPPGSSRAAIQGLAAPFEEHPPRAATGRGDPNTFWPSTAPLPEPDLGEPGATPGDADGNGFLDVHGPQMGVELRDFDGDNDLDVLFSYGDGGLPRINRVFLNDQPAEGAAIGPTRGRNSEGREVLHWRDEVSFTCFQSGAISQVSIEIFPEESGGAPPLTGTKTAAQAAADARDENGDGLPDFVFTFPELFPRHGDTRVVFHVTDGGATRDKEQNIFIDPSGIVFDIETRRPIVGARVVLEVLDGGGAWVLPPASDIRPPVNPQLTGTDGGYGWDVVPGRYRVRVSATGYEGAISREVTIPPPVLDLDVGLAPDRPPHLLWQDTVQLSKKKKRARIHLDPAPRFDDRLRRLAPNGLRYREAPPGSRFHGAFLNWPLDEIGLTLDPVSGVISGEVDAKAILSQEDPFFLGLIEVLDAESGEVVAEIWLELHFVRH